VSAFVLSFGLIFLAELGDKSQLVALWLATRYRPALVLTGVTVATLVVHLGSTAIGASVADLLPQWLALSLVGVSFFVFAWWGLQDESVSEAAPPPAFAGLGPFVLVTSAFFLSELGDKTQLATVSIAGERADFLGVWLGSTLGMVAADAVAIGAGRLIGDRLPRRVITRAAALVFVAFGALALGRAMVAAV
jgi:putative Ca2+/H+ antiporter (TMEM165/GDT1 family)